MELTDKEIMDAMPKQLHEDLAKVCQRASDSIGVDVAGMFRVCLNRGIVDHCRAAIAAHEAARPAPAPVPTFLDAIRLANGCHDYSGGYLCEAADVYHAGITTVVNVLRKAAIGPWDSQTNAVFAMGSARLNTPAPTPEEVEARFLAWWAESYPHAPVGSHAVASHVAFALHLLGGEVAA